MSICDLCDKPDAEDRIVAIIQNQGPMEGEHQLEWHATLCPSCESDLADELTYLLARASS